MRKSNNMRHLVMRFADSLCEGIDTIEEHKQVIRQHGSVWLGKLGRPLSAHKINQLNRQINAKHATFLYLVQKRGGRYTWTQATLVGIDTSLPAGSRVKTPVYYDKFGVRKQISTWFHISSFQKASPSGLRLLHVESSGRPILETLSGSMAAIFMVTIGASKGLETHCKSRRQKFNLHQAVLDVFEED